MNKKPTRNYTSNHVITLTPSESKESISNLSKSPLLIKDELKQGHISSDDEREFEKFIMQTACNTEHIDTDRDTNNYDADLSIISFISPQINKIKSSTVNLNSALTKAKSSYSIFKQGQYHLNQTHLKYETKRERLRNIYREYKQYEIELKQFEEELKQNRTNTEMRMKAVNVSNSKMNNDIVIFNQYFDSKIEELNFSLNREKEFQENNERRAVELLKREQEISMRHNKINHVEQEIVLKEKELNIHSNNTHDSLLLMRQSNSLNCNEALNVNCYEDKEAILEQLNQQIIKKTEEMEALNEKKTHLSQLTINQLGELNLRLASADIREKEIALLQKDLEKKLREVKEKLLETQRITHNLQMKEDYINLLRSTNRSLDDKLSTFEITEALNQTKRDIYKKNQ